MKKIIILVLMLGIMYGVVIDPEFRGNKFGISKNQIQENGVLYSDNEEHGYILYQVEWNGFLGSASYMFEDGKLFYGSYYFVGEEATNEWIDVLVATYGYGKKSGENIIWVDNDNNTMIKVRFNINDDYDTIEISIYDFKIYLAILDEEQKAKVKKL